MATYYRYDGFLKTVNGQAIAGAQVYVCNDINVNLTNPPTPLATVYADNAGANVIVQPGGSLTTDGFGHFFFYALEGVYALVTVNAGVVRLYLPDQTIGPVGAVGLGTVTNNEGPLPANTIIVGGPSGGNDIQTSGILISNLGTVLSVAGAGIATGVVNTIGFITVVGSGSTQVAATANSNLALAPVGHVLVADGNGNVEDSGIPLSIVGGGTVTNNEGPLTANTIIVGGPGGGNDVQTSGVLLSNLATTASLAAYALLSGATFTGAVYAPEVDAPVVVNAQGSGVSAYIAVLGDANQLVTMSDASASTFTVPLNSSVAFPVGTTLTVSQLGAGQITLTPAGGMTFHTPSSLTTRVQYSTVSVVQTAANVWLASGDLT